MFNDIASASIHRVDPISFAIRRSVVLNRRVYHCEGPNAVWHVDGHHKVIRWRFVTHGPFDGYSRTTTYLTCSDNNRSTTVLSSFVNAVQLNGLPTKVQTDKGGENIEIWHFMIEQHSSNTAVITGSSTHNERIERLWRDVHRCVGSLFYSTFKDLESQGALDPLNEVDLFSLHFVYIPRINSTLTSFRESWNNNPSSTERNLTPNQLFVAGAMSQPDELVNGDNIVVPNAQFSPCPQLQQALEGIDQLRSSSEFGKDIYIHVVQIVGFHLQTVCICCAI